MIAVVLSRFVTGTPTATLPRMSEPDTTTCSRAGGGAGGGGAGGGDTKSGDGTAEAICV